MMRYLCLLLALAAPAAADESQRQVKLLDVLRSGQRLGLNQLAFSPNGKLLAASSRDQTILIWDVARRAVIAVLPMHGDALAFGPESKTLAAVGNGVVRIWDVASGKETATLKAKATNAAGLAFSPDGKLLATTGNPFGWIQLWDLGKGAVSRTLKTRGGNVRLAFSPDGKTLIASSLRDVELWDVTTGKLSARVNLLTVNYEAPTVVSADGKSAVTALGKVILWSTSDGKPVRQLTPTERSGDPKVLSLALSPDGRIVAMGRQDKSLTLLDTRNGKVTAKIDPQVLVNTSLLGTTLAFSPDGKILAAITGEDLMLWNAARGEVVDRLRHYDGPAQHLAFSWDGKLLAAVDYRGVDLWEIDGRKHRLSIAVPWNSSDSFRAASFSPDGKALALAGHSRELLKLYDTAKGKVVAAFDSAQLLESAAYSPDGKTLAAGGNKVTLWDVTTRKKMATFKGPTHVTFLAFDRGGKVLASGWDDGAFNVWDVKTGKKLVDVSLLEKGERSFTSVGFSPDGKRVASGGATGIVKLWDAATGKMLRALKGHDGSVHGLGFSSNGKLLASGGADGIVNLWDVASGKKLRELRGHTGPIRSVAISPTNSIVVVAAGGSVKGALYVWELLSTVKK